LWLHILLQASCKTAMETVPFCFRNQSKSLAQSITSSYTGNSFTLYSLYSLLQITTATCAFQKSPTKLPAQRQPQHLQRRKKLFVSRLLYHWHQKLQEFQCTHKEKNKTTTCFASLLTTRKKVCKSEEACHRDLIASSYKKSITKQKVSLSYEKPGPQYYSAPLNIPWTPSQSQICVGDGHLHSIRYSTYHCYPNKFTPWDLVMVRRLGMNL
jgi:hypothetical protein